MDRGDELVGDVGDRDVVDVDFGPPDQEQQQIQGTAEHIKRDGAGEVAALAQFAGFTDLGDAAGSARISGAGAQVVRAAGHGGICRDHGLGARGQGQGLGPRPEVSGQRAVVRIALRLPGIGNRRTIQKAKFIKICA